MKEVEVKILEINRRKVLATLRRIGAKKVFHGPMTAVYFDFSDGRLKKNKKVLRLRTKREQVELTLKEKIHQKKAKVMNEIQTHISDFERMKEIFEHLGLKTKRKNQKHRISYKLGKSYFELDKYPGVPLFLEIESPSIKLVKKWVKRFGYSMKDAKPWSAFDVLKHYGRSSS